VCTHVTVTTKCCRFRNSLWTAGLPSNTYPVITRHIHRPQESSNVSRLVACGCVITRYLYAYTGRGTSVVVEQFNSLCNKHECLISGFAAPSQSLRLAARASAALEPRIYAPAPCRAARFKKKYLIVAYTTATGDCELDHCAQLVTGKKNPCSSRIMSSKTFWSDACERAMRRPLQRLDAAYASCGVTVR
jgi:hypothetical protein